MLKEGSPVRESFIFTNIAQRQLFIEIVYTVFSMANPSCYLELCSLFIWISIEFGSLQLFFIKIVPVNVLEPGIILEGNKGRTSQSTLRLILIQQLIHQLPGLFIFQRSRIFQLKIKYLLVYFQRIFALLSERDIAAHELEHIDAQRIQANCESIAFSYDYLGSHVMRRSDQSKSLGRHDISTFYDFSGHQINELQVPYHIHHEVLRLQIPHDNPLGCQILQSQYHNSRIELSILSRQNTYLSNNIIKFLSLNKLHKRIQIMLILKTFVILHDERVVQTSQQILLLGYVFEERVFFYLLLVVALQDVEFLLLELVSAAHQQNRTELALFQLLEDDQLIQPVYQLISSFYLLMKLLGLSLLVLFDNGVEKSPDDLLHNISLDLSNNAI